MKDIFNEYYLPDESEFEYLWREGYFVFDTNILLMLYRYSIATTNEVFAVFRLLRDRIWLPYQVAFEYQENRLRVIAEVISRYKEFNKQLDSWSSQIESKVAPPFFDDSLVMQIRGLIEQIRKSVDEDIKRTKDLRRSDTLREQLDALFEGKVGDGFHGEDLSKIFKEGEERYEKSIPPGFKDVDKREGVRRFGDLVIWKEILRLGRESNKPILFITNDEKSDWWNSDGREFGPRTELLREFFVETSQRIHFYNSENFLKYANKFVGATASKGALEEISESLERQKFLFDIGYEDINTPNDPQLDALEMEVLSTDFDSDRFPEIQSNYEKALFRHQSTNYLRNVYPRLSSGIKEKRRELVFEIKSLLADCRACGKWDERSEYKLPGWLERVPEEMIPYTSINKMIKIRDNLAEYLRLHKI